MKKQLCWLAGTAALVLAGAASAEVVTFEFQGTVTYTTYMASVGAPITGRFSWDTDAPVGPVDPNYQVATYMHPYTFGISAKVGPHTISSDQLSVTVFNNLGGNAEDMIDITGIAPVVDGTTFSSGYLAIRLASGPGSSSVFRDTRLPQHLELARFDSQSVNYTQLLVDGSSNGVVLDVKLESIRRVPSAR